MAVLPLGLFGPSLLYLAATNDWRSAFMKAAVVWGLIVVASTEALSPFRALSATPLAAVWADALLAVTAVPLAFIAVATGVIAWVAPPNTYDSMAYHMARVAHWAADGTVADYQTNILRQLYLPPWSEFAVLQLLVLS